MEAGISCLSLLTNVDPLGWTPRPIQVRTSSGPRLAGARRRGRALDQQPRDLDDPYTVGLQHHDAVGPAGKHVSPLSAAASTPPCIPRQRLQTLCRRPHGPAETADGTEIVGTMIGQTAEHSPNTGQTGTRGYRLRRWPIRWASGDEVSKRPVRSCACHEPCHAQNSDPHHPVSAAVVEAWFASGPRATLLRPRVKVVPYCCTTAGGAQYVDHSHRSTP